MIKIGSLVTRISHNNDVIFKVLDIKDNIVYLKGSDVRLYADADISDLVETDLNDDFRPNININMERNEYFYIPAKILHLDGDEDYLIKSIEYYKDAGVMAVGKKISEEEMPIKIAKILEDTKPDILVITGHDAHYNDNTYKNSSYFIKAVQKAREYEKSHEKLVIIAGACQSDYENLIKSGANFASSPKRINIHALDPSIIAVNIATTDKRINIDIKDLLSKTKNGKDGLGGIISNGMMYVGYPR